MPEDNAQAADETRKLRARFPRWGILFDPLESVWVAVRGKRTLVAASNPGALTERVEAAARGEMGPDEGEQTQTWAVNSSGSEFCRSRASQGRFCPEAMSRLG